MKETFNNVRGKRIEKIYSMDHLDAGHVVPKSLNNNRVEWRCTICGRKFTSKTYSHSARMKAWDCAASHSDDCQKYREGCM